MESAWTTRTRIKKETAIERDVKKRGNGDRDRERLGGGLIGCRHRFLGGGGGFIVASVASSARRVQGGGVQVRTGAPGRDRKPERAARPARCLFSSPPSSFLPERGSDPRPVPVTLSLSLSLFLRILFLGLSFPSYFTYGSFGVVIYHREK